MSRRETVIAVIATAAVIVVLALGNPASESWFLKCPLYQTTGIQCPLCGSQRALHEMAHGHIATAWNYNPALWVFILYLLFVASGHFSPRIRQSKTYQWWSGDKGIFTVIGLLLLWGVVRNLL